MVGTINIIRTRKRTRRAREKNPPALLFLRTVDGVRVGHSRFADPRQRESKERRAN